MCSLPQYNSTITNSSAPVVSSKYRNGTPRSPSSQVSLSPPNSGAGSRTNHSAHSSTRPSFNLGRVSISIRGPRSSRPSRTTFDALRAPIPRSYSLPPPDRDHNQDHLVLLKTTKSSRS
eukprot:1381257-Amorphochlora_amoeboformis.AAC.2